MRRATRTVNCGAAAVVALWTTSLPYYAATTPLHFADTVRRNAAEPGAGENTASADAIDAESMQLHQLLELPTSAPGQILYDVALTVPPSTAPPVYDTAMTLPPTPKLPPPATGGTAALPASAPTSSTSFPRDLTSLISSVGVNPTRGAGWAERTVVPPNIPGESTPTFYLISTGQRCSTAGASGGLQEPTAAQCRLYADTNRTFSFRGTSAEGGEVESGCLIWAGTAIFFQNNSVEWPCRAEQCVCVSVNAEVSAPTDIVNGTTASTHTSRSSNEESLPQCNCAQYREGASPSHRNMCQGPTESWGSPCHPLPVVGSCHGGWRMCAGTKEASPSSTNTTTSSSMPTSTQPFIQNSTLPSTLSWTQEPATHEVPASPDVRQTIAPSIAPRNNTFEYPALVLNRPPTVESSSATMFAPTADLSYAPSVASEFSTTTAPSQLYFSSSATESPSELPTNNEVTISAALPAASTISLSTMAPPITHDLGGGSVALSLRVAPPATPAMERRLVEHALMKFDGAAFFSDVDFSYWSASAASPRLIIVFRPGVISLRDAQAAAASITATSRTGGYTDILSAVATLNPSSASRAPSYAPTVTPTSSTVPSSQSCCTPEVLGGVRWNAPRGCSTAPVAAYCPESTVYGLRRRCLRLAGGVRQWSPITSQCTNRRIAGAATRMNAITDATLENVTSEVENVVYELNNATREASSTLSPTDISAVSSVLNTSISLAEQHVVNLTESLSLAIVNTISDVVAAPAAREVGLEGNTLADTMHKTMETLATLLTNVDTGSKIVQIVSPRIVTTSVVISANVPLRWPLIPVSEEGLQDCSMQSGCTHAGSIVETSTFSGVTLALPPLSAMMDGNVSEAALAQAIVIVYKDDTLFQTDAALLNSLQPTGFVVSASIPSGRSSGQFSSDATMRYRIAHDSTGRDLASRTSAWFDHNLGAWNSSGCRIVEEESNADFTTCSCSHLTSFSVLMDVSGEDTPRSQSDNQSNNSSHAFALSMLTLVGCGLSIVCLMMTVVVYSFFPGAQTLQKKILFHLCVSLATAMSVFLVAATANPLSSIACQSISASLHFSLLSAFCWMLIEGVHLYSTFMDIFRTVFDESRLLWRYATFSYGAPAAIAATAAALGTHDGEFCWLSGSWIWAFAGPVILIVSANVFVFARILSVILGVRMHAAEASFVKEARYIKLKRGFKASLTFFSVMGITWALGLLSLQDQDQIVWQYLFALFNAFGGCWIFYLHCISDPLLRQEIRAYWQHKVIWSNKNSSESSGHPRAGRLIHDTPNCDHTDESGANTSQFSSSNASIARGMKQPRKTNLVGRRSEAGDWLKAAMQSPSIQIQAPASSGEVALEWDTYTSSSLPQRCTTKSHPPRKPPHRQPDYDIAHEHPYHIAVATEPEYDVADDTGAEYVLACPSYIDVALDLIPSIDHNEMNGHKTNQPIAGSLATCPSEKMEQQLLEVAIDDTPPFALHTSNVIA